MSGTRSSPALRLQCSPAIAGVSSRCRRTRAIAAGLTLIELLIACAILLLLSTAALPLTKMTVKRRKEEQLRYDLRQIRDAIDRYKDYADQGKFQTKVGTEGYPPDLDTLYKGVKITAAGAATAGAVIPGAVIPGATTAGGTPAGASPEHQMRFLRKIPIDPMTGNPDWGLRSVQDDPDTTAWGGQDVFDVYTKSTGTALNGTKYSDW
jgi:general secretion pathway protein G